jgi:hypothetical protein
MRGKRCGGLAETCLENGQSREKVPMAVAPFDYFPRDGRFAEAGCGKYRPFCQLPKPSVTVNNVSLPATPPGYDLCHGEIAAGNGIDA